MHDYCLYVHNYMFICTNATITSTYQKRRKETGDLDGLFFATDLPCVARRNCYPHEHEHLIVHATAPYVHKSVIAWLQII